MVGKLEQAIVEQGCGTALHHKCPLRVLKDTFPVASTPQPVLQTLESSDPASFHAVRCLTNNASVVSVPL